MQIFDFKNHQIRTVTINDEPWFVAIDVCRALEITNPSDVIKRLDTDERARFNLGRQGETNIVNESGLYSLILGSRKPEAKEFKRWITKSVIPSIRKHGAYMTPQTIEEALLNPDTIIKIATQLKEEQAKTKQLETKIEEDRPKVIFAEALETSADSIMIADLAKILKQNGIDIGQNRLIEVLRKDGYLCRRGSYKNAPTQKAMNLGLFEIATTIISSEGKVKTVRAPRVTAKGQIYFVNRFKRQRDPMYYNDLFEGIEV